MPISISKNSDLNAIKDKKQKAIAKSNLIENSKRKQINYNPEDWILIKNPGIIRKLAVLYDGPYKVVLVYITQIMELSHTKKNPS